MKRIGWAAAVLGLAVVVAIVWAYAPPPKTGPSPQSVAFADREDGARRAALQATPQARAYRDRKAFETGVRDFLRDAPRMGAVARSERERTLSAEIDVYERAGQMSAGEALMLRVALIRAGGADGAQAAERIAETIERYRVASERRQAAWQAKQNGDSRFRDYKARERAVVAEVMAMRDIPGGLSRDEYLRLRLEQERIQAYR